MQEPKGMKAKVDARRNDILKIIQAQPGLKNKQICNILGIRIAIGSHDLNYIKQFGNIINIDQRYYINDDSLQIPAEQRIRQLREKNEELPKFKWNGNSCVHKCGMSFNTAKGQSIKLETFISSSLNSYI